LPGKGEAGLKKTPEEGDGTVDEDWQAASKNHRLERKKEFARERGTTVQLQSEEGFT